MTGVPRAPKHLPCHISAKKPSKSEGSRATHGRADDCAGPLCASATAPSQVAVSGAVADRSAVHHFEAKTGASAWRIFFFKRHLPDKMYPGRLTVKVAKIIPAMISMK